MRTATQPAGELPAALDEVRAIGASHMVRIIGCALLLRCFPSRPHNILTLSHVCVRLRIFSRDLRLQRVPLALPLSTSHSHLCARRDAALVCVRARSGSVGLRAATRSGSPSSSRLVGFAGCHTLGLTILLALCGYTSCDTLGLTSLLKTSG